MMPKIVVVAKPDSSKILQAKAFSEEWGFELVGVSDAQNTDYELHFSDEKIFISSSMSKNRVASCVDFISGAKAHRRKYGGGKGQAIAKAIGLNKTANISVVDATAGMGGDAFVMASLGCRVTLVERSPIVRVLLEDGLNRALHYACDQDPELLDIISRMHLVKGDSLEVLVSEVIRKHQVVYLDPMFPSRKKSAEVKKDMQFFHDIVGNDNDAAGLLEVALGLAENRVVVKRPKIAPYLAGREPGYQLMGKSGRFDIYPLKAFT
ncbi:class I SAM-dependent methyltransferase [Teredinibacter purpureus]|uniref:class I SAM-dependent methyltransferase n=1 Tax=Teredinibacter purpureus TaxID=2731756 RepID=UPI000B1CDC29|nr:class I SAM-dependent methyltransferase [Teredinibacter purpureus]